MARILLADDEAASRDLVRLALEADGHVVACMSGGTEALERLTQGPQAFDLIVTDVNMPGMDGIELARQALTLNNGLGVVLMSGFVEQLERARQLDAIRVGVIAKPFTLDQMRATVRRVLAV
jgi:CheY-like chemotaxis protein